MILHDERRGLDFTVPETGTRLGRDPGLDITFPEDDNVVSALHARAWREADGSWWVQDLGSTNGTWLNGRRIEGPERVRSGDRFTLGQRGPALKVSVPGELARTQAEKPIDVSRPLLRLRRVKGGEDLIGTGSEMVIGRASTCAIPLRTVVDTVVSKHHCVVEIQDDGGATIEDLGSKNGTWVNGQQIQGKAALRVGDRIMLGWHGPLLEVRILGPAMLAEGEGAAYRPELQPPKTLAGMVQAAGGEARDATGVRAGLFVRSMARQMAKESSFAFRGTVLGLLAASLAGVGFVYRTTSRQAAAAEARLDSTRRALAQEIHTASEAQQRSQAEIAGLQQQLATARQSSVSREVLDSLERRLRQAEAAAASREAAPSPATAAGSADFARVAAENQRAVGLVLVRYGFDSVMGSGFVITPSGYFVTNRHVVQEDGREQPRSVEVTMADTRTPLAADIVSVSTVDGVDIAILKIRGYRGAVVREVDWEGAAVRQGAAAALIGFPGGTQLAVDQSGVLRTSLFVGVIAQATLESIRFGGVTYPGSSGSPLFNAEGAVIAVHYGGLERGAGLGFSVPITRVRRWLPPEARAELHL